MFVSKNNKNRTWFVGHRMTSNEKNGMFYSVPFKLSKRATRLTIKLGKDRVDLDGHQVNLLKKVLIAGDHLKDES